MEIIGKPRQLIPRWHTSRKLSVLHLPPSKKIAASPKIDGEKFSSFRMKNTIDEWKFNKNYSSAVELISKSFLLEYEDSDVIDAKIFLETDLEGRSASVKSLIRPNERPAGGSNLYPTSKNDIYRIIRGIRLSLKDHPKDPLAWNDIAFYYAALGNNEKADKCLNIAYVSSKKNPIVARAYSRFIIHQGDPEKALHILSRSGDTKANPLLASANLAIRSIYNIGKVDRKSVLELIRKYESSPEWISELAASMATISCQHGSLKEAIKLIETSLTSPTENTIAQISWLKHKKYIEIEDAYMPEITSLESKVIKLYETGDYSGLKDSLLELHNFQPFSERPIIDAGYISLVVLEDPIEAIRIYESNQHITQKSFMARNNYVFALLECNRIVEAADQFKDLHGLIKNKSDLAVFRATSAMQLYKAGRPEEGRALYESVADYFQSENDLIHLGRLYYYFSLQEKSVDIDKSKHLLGEANRILRKIDDTKEILEKISIRLMELQ
jgi:tetratricopeptide (TPR) repeat protein